MILESLLDTSKIHNDSEPDDSPKVLDDAGLEKVFTVSKLRRYFLERISFEAKLNKDHPIVREKWGRLKYITKLLAASKSPL